MRSIPTMILFRDGKQTSRMQGYIPDAKLRTHLDRYAPSPEATTGEEEAPARGGLLARIFGGR